MVEKSGEKTSIPLNNIINQMPVSDEIVFKETGYIINTKAGDFDCELIITKVEPEFYKVTFYNDKVLFHVVRTFYLNENDFLLFKDAGKMVKEKYRTDMTMEICEIGNNK